MKKGNILKIIFLLLLITYLTLYFSSISGYYEYRNYKKMTLTEEQIQRFEKDIKDGKNIDIEDYMIEEQTVKNNKLANLGKKISIGISNTMSTVVIKSFSYLGKFVKE